MPPPPLPLRAGQRLNEFVLLAPLASSGSSALYLAHPTGHGRPRERASALLASLGFWRGRCDGLAALKVAYPDYQANLHDEHGYLSRADLRHPHLVDLYSRRCRRPKGQTPRDLGLARLPGEGRSLAYLALAFEPGPTLARLLYRRRARPLDPTLAVHIAHQTAQALRHLHDHELVHHDVKPGNIILRPTQGIADVALIDLGAAESLRAPRQRSVYGTWRYLPPERLTGSGSHSLTPQIDVYGLGRTLEEMLTGSLDEDDGAAAGNVPGRVAAARVERPRISAELDHLVRDATTRCLEQRWRRLPSMHAFIERLEATPEFRRPPTPIRV
ncbi:MAG: protein kinase [Chloroflexaceae bacterium]